jgi:hypothetical protein
MNEEPEHRSTLTSTTIHTAASHGVLGEWIECNNVKGCGRPVTGHRRTGHILVSYMVQVGSHVLRTAY